MDPSNAHDQEMRADDQSLESILLTGGGSKVQQQQQQQQDDMMSKPTNKPAQPEHALKCPRCDSTNTKFCYYNNYSLSQPRYFCKSCRRYWTKGGTLRNVPVGGGCRKNKRTSSSSSSKRNILITHQENPNHLLNNFYDHSNSSDQLLALTHLQHKLSHGHFGNYDHLMDHQSQGFLETQGLNHMQNLYYGFADVGEVSSGVSISNNNNNQDHMSMFQCEEHVKQEPCSGRENESRFLLGNFPWQNIGGGDGGAGVNSLAEFGGSMRGSWNNGINIGSSNWQGLINSPLM